MHFLRCYVGIRVARPRKFPILPEVVEGVFVVAVVRTGALVVAAFDAEEGSGVDV